jgi:hypothetical protein
MVSDDDKIIFVDVIYWCRQSDLRTFIRGVSFVGLLATRDTLGQGRSECFLSKILGEILR